MNTKLLKQKILDLAIRGKLTQQLKSDGTAADLLKKIAEAKSSLSQPKGKKSKDLGQIIPLDKSDVPFEIPANWEWVCVDSIASLITDGEHLTPRRVESFEGYYLLSARNIQDDEILLNDVDYVDEDEYNRIAKRCNPRKNDVLISCSGSIGRVTVVKDDNKYVMVRSAAMIRPVFVHSCYLMYVLQSNCLQSQIQNYSKQTAQANLFQAAIRALQFPLPPLVEQQRIVEKIQEAFAEIDSIENNKELLKTHIKQARQKILDLAIHGKLVPQNKTDEPASVLLERITRDNPHYEKLTDIPFEIPDSWEWTRLGDVCHFIGGGTPDKSDLKYWNGSINWASVKDIKGLELTDTVDKITEAGFKESAASYAEKEDLILVTRINPGMCVQTKIKTAINQDLKVVKVPSQINKIYVMFFCNYAQKWFLEKSSGTTVKGIKIDAVLQMPFPLPPLAEQKRIVDRIEEIFASLDEISLHLV